MCTHTAVTVWLAVLLPILDVVCNLIITHLIQVFANTHVAIDSSVAITITSAQ